MRLFPIYMIYTREKTFSWLVLIFLLSVALTFIATVFFKIFFGSLSKTSGNLYSSIFQSTLVMEGIWMMFLWGIMLKCQFASHRASLIPHYRTTHVAVFGSIFGLLSAVWLTCVLFLASCFHVGADDQLAVIAAAFLVAAMCLVLGYVSSIWITSLCFIAFCLFSDPVYMALGGKIGFFVVNVWTLVFIIFMVIVFLIRLMCVREESWEYGYLLSWSGKTSVWRDRNWITITRFLTALRRILSLKDGIGIPVSYAQSKSLLARALHWEIFKWNNYHLMVMGLLFLLPLYIVYINFLPEHFSSFLNDHMKYLFLAVYPVLLSVMLNLKNIMLYWGYEMTRPVRRENFILEKGIGLLMEIGFYWLIAVVFVMVVPYGVLDVKVLGSMRFWAEIILTAAFALMTFGWTVCIRGMAPGVFGGSIFFVIGLSFYQFLSLKSWSMTNVFIVSFFLALVGIGLCRIGYKRWIESEFP